ncbi:hypothetical protein, conserved [Plasmodium gonderi]|uniref:F-box domain-containing protein n=1 Tax=Plasmodium gonderi TaxID=77519 RepID=A0A1Y1JD09_PLAGO|nr:hypothetical protein, conserved [Plasmodium gonderi]GAW80411.1 hypothetical protein, conserved [Plasmodium gonderi]
MNAICTTSVIVQLLEFFPFLDDLFTLMYLNRSWKAAILDVITNTNFLNAKKIMRMKNKKYILLILKYMKGSSRNGREGELIKTELVDRIEHPLEGISPSLRHFPNVLELIIGSCNLSPLFFNCIQNMFPQLVCFKIFIKSPVCIPLLKNFCFNSKNLRRIIITIGNSKLNTDYREKLEKNLNKFFRHWGIDITLITQLRECPLRGKL